MPAKGGVHSPPLSCVMPGPVNAASCEVRACCAATERTMETSIYLAKLMGPIYLVVAIGMLLDREQFRAVAKEFATSPGLFYLSGIIALIIGGLIVILNNVWSGWPIVITLVGWAAIAKGVART